jgi:hypothetical protein
MFLFCSMTRNAGKQARVEAMLGELAELSLGVARELAVRLRESEDTDETVALAGAFQKMSRVVRLTLALDARLEREAARDAAAEARDAQKAEAEAAVQRQLAALGLGTPPAADTPIEARKARVRGLMNRLLWTESEGEEEDYEVLVEDLNARLDEAALSPDFEDLPIEALARRMIADMGLSGELALSLGEPKPAPARELQTADTG